MIKIPSQEEIGERQYRDFVDAVEKKLKEENKMEHEGINIKITNNGFYVEVGCENFVFGKEKDMFEAISLYKKDPEKAKEKYCK